jgi:hypothetical protein
VKDGGKSRTSPTKEMPLAEGRNEIRSYAAVIIRAD